MIEWFYAIFHNLRRRSWSGGQRSTPEGACFKSPSPVSPKDTIVRFCTTATATEDRKPECVQSVLPQCHPCSLLWSPLLACGLAGAIQVSVVGKKATWAWWMPAVSPCTHPGLTSTNLSDSTPLSHAAVGYYLCIVDLWSVMYACDHLITCSWGFLPRSSLEVILKCAGDWRSDNLGPG